MKKIIFILIILSVNLLATNKVDNLILFKVISEKEIIKPNIEMIKTSLEANLTSLGYGIIDEKIQEEALKEQKKQQSSDCYDDQCLVDTGRMLTAKKLLIIRVSKKSDNNFFIKLRKIDIETGIIENSSASTTILDFQNYENLDKIIKEQIKKVFKSNIQIETKKIYPNQINKGFIEIMTLPKDAEIYTTNNMNNNYYYKQKSRLVEKPVIRNQIKKLYLFKSGFLLKEYELNYKSPESIKIELQKAPKFNLKLNTKVDYKISYIQFMSKSAGVYNSYSKNTFLSTKKYFPKNIKTMKLPQGKYKLTLTKKGYRPINKTINLNKDKVLAIEDIKEKFFFATIEIISEYKMFFNIDNIKLQDLYFGAKLNFLTILNKEFKLDVISLGLLSNFKKGEDLLLNIKVSLLNMELFTSNKNFYVSFSVFMIFGDGDIINDTNNNYFLISPAGFKFGYKFDIIKEKLTFKAYQKADWVIYEQTGEEDSQHGLALTTGLSLEYLF